MPDIIKQCRISGEDYVISEWEQGFLNRMGLPFPTLSPEERLKRRLSHRNERKIYKDKCDLTGKPIISLYSEDKPFTVYSQEVWWGDDWDPREYGRDFDFSRPFFEQFHELQLKVPRLSLMNTKAHNSEYCNITTSNKNCYLVFGGDFNEDCMYGIFSMHSKNCFDLYWSHKSELCYEMIDCNSCYNCKYMQDCRNCRDSAFLFECQACENCYGCVNLRNKQYHIFNEAYSKEEYEAKIKEFRLDSFSGVQQFAEKFENFSLKFPRKFADLVNCENCVGDKIANAKNCRDCFDVEGPAEDMKDMFLGGFDLKDVASSDHVGHKGELFYEMLGSIEGSNYAFGTFVWGSNDIYYCDMIVNNSHDLFGCCNMKKASYCILNKQYSKEEYFELRGRIIEHMKSTGEWGEFFPMKYSPFAYNETVAQDYFAMSREEALAVGLKWLEEEKREVGSGDSIPDSIFDVTDDILQKNLVCEKTGRPYKINDKELAFYRQMQIPIPHFALETRNEMRLAKRNPHKLWDRKCAKCSADIKTSYADSRPEIVYCEKCYLEEVY